MNGSSPHLRGTLVKHGLTTPIARFIPAPAGNTRVSLNTSIYGTVHPRTCGEHGTPTFSMMSAPGSSPHLRGTPARHRPSFVYALHPRTCGEHVPTRLSPSGRTASSPHLRGTRLPLAERPGFARFIPAPAGNTPTIPFSWSGRTLHPRTCGEHSVVLIPAFSSAASSPHLRGTHFLYFVEFTSDFQTA